MSGYAMATPRHYIIRNNIITNNCSNANSADVVEKLKLTIHSVFSRATERTSKQQQQQQRATLQNTYLAGPLRVSRVLFPSRRHSFNIRKPKCSSFLLGSRHRRRRPLRIRCGAPHPIANSQYPKCSVRVHAVKFNSI